MLRHDIIKSPAYLALSPAERAVLIQIWQRLSHNGSNNGMIAVGHETLSNECNIARNTTAKAIKRLEEIGFLEIVKKGSFNCKIRHVSEYRLCFMKCIATGELPSDKWRHFKPEN